MLEGVGIGLDSADRLRPGSGSFGVKLATDFHSIGAIGDISGRIGENLSIFGEAGAFAPFRNIRDISGEVKVGIRGTW